MPYWIIVLIAAGAFLEGLALGVFIGSLRGAQEEPPEPEPDRASQMERIAYRQCADRFRAESKLERDVREAIEYAERAG